MPAPPSKLANRETRQAERLARFNQWSEKFHRSDAGAIAIRALIDRTTDNDTQFEELKECVLTACFNAHSFYTDEETDYRRLVLQLKEFSNLQQEHVQAARAIKSMARRFNEVVSMVLRYGHNPVKGPAIREGSRFTMEPSETLLAMLTAFEDGLPRFNNAKPALELEFGRIEGCLRYPSERKFKVNRLSGATNSLIFELTLLMRRWSTQAPLYIRERDIMEETGEPHFAIVAAFTNATFLNRAPHTGTGVRSRLKKLLNVHQGIEYYPWS